MRSIIRDTDRTLEMQVGFARLPLSRKPGQGSITRHTVQLAKRLAHALGNVV